VLPGAVPPLGSQSGERSAIVWACAHQFPPLLNLAGQAHSQGWGTRRFSTGSGIVDEKDGVYSRLRLWIDENHDGRCQPEELHRLPELGVYSLALNYVESRRTDQFGNLFRYRARIDPGDRGDPRDQTPTGDPGRWAYDVFFVTK